MECIRTDTHTQPPRYCRIVSLPSVAIEFSSICFETAIAWIVLRLYPAGVLSGALCDRNVVMGWLPNGNPTFAAILAGVTAFVGYALFRLTTAQSTRQRMVASLKLGIGLAIGLAAVLAIEVRSLTR